MKEKTYIASFGAIPSPTDIRDYRLTDVACAQAFPEEFELPMCAVKN